MKKTISWLISPPIDGRKEIILIRLMAGGVFFWEGLLKFVYPNQGVGRFTKLGFPMPELTANFIAITEIVGGALLLFGLLTRLTALWFVLEMIIAMLTTKVSLYLGTSALPLPASPPQTGFWAVLHEIRSDYAQALTCLFLVYVGPGVLSLDSYLKRRKVQRYSTDIE